MRTTQWGTVTGPPRPATTLPAPVRAVAAGRPARAVWVNELGGLTFEVGAGADRCFVKWAPVTAIGEDLRAMHEATPAAACPFSWLAEDRLADTRRRAGEGRIDPARWHPVHQPLGLDQALGLLADIPPAGTEWNYGPGWDKLLLTAYGCRLTRTGPGITGCSGTSAPDP